MAALYTVSARDEHDNNVDTVIGSHVSLKCLQIHKDS